LERAEAYDLHQARQILRQLEGYDRAVRLRDFQQIEQLRDELARLVGDYQERQPSLRSLLQIIRATNIIHKMSERALLGLSRLRDEESEKAKALLANHPNLPACISMPREARGVTTPGN
jgi:hypothetical protein